MIDGVSVVLNEGRLARREPVGDEPVQKVLPGVARVRRVPRVQRITTVGQLLVQHDGGQRPRRVDDASRCRVQ